MELRAAAKLREKGHAAGRGAGGCWEADAVLRSGFHAKHHHAVFGYARRIAAHKGSEIEMRQRVTDHES